MGHTAAPWLTARSHRPMLVPRTTSSGRGAPKPNEVARYGIGGASLPWSATAPRPTTTGRSSEGERSRGRSFVR